MHQNCFKLGTGLRRANYVVRARYNQAMKKGSCSYSYIKYKYVHVLIPDLTLYLTC